MGENLGCCMGVLTITSLRNKYNPASKVERIEMFLNLFLTNKNANTGSLNPKEQAALITDYCNTNQYFC